MRVVMLRSNPVDPYPRLEKSASYLLEAGHKVTVIAWDRRSNYGAKKEKLFIYGSQCSIIRIGIKGEFSAGFKKNIGCLVRFQIFLYNWLNKHSEEYDIIHAYDFDTGFIAYKVAHNKNKKFVYDIADYYTASHKIPNVIMRNWIKNNENKLINNSDATIICSEQRIKQISPAKPKKLVIIHNSPRIEELQIEDLNLNNKKLKIAYIGVLAGGRFIKEIAEVVLQRDDCEFHVAGFGKLQKYFEKLDKKNDSIFYYGKISYKRTLSLEKSCDVITAIYDPNVPNHKYAAPNKFYEALSLGKPIIAVKNTGFDNVVSENEIGEVINYTKEELNSAIDKLKLNGNKLKEIEKKELLIYDELYSWQIIRKKVQKLYEEI